MKVFMPLLNSINNQRATIELSDGWNQWSHGRMMDKLYGYMVDEL